MITLGKHQLNLWMFEINSNINVKQKCNYFKTEAIVFPMSAGLSAT